MISTKIDIAVFRDAEGWGLRVNGRVRVRGETADLVFAVRYVLEDSRAPVKRGAHFLIKAAEIARRILDDIAKEGGQR